MSTTSNDSKGDFLVKYQNETYNLSRFLHKHPGGLNTLGPLKNCDLTKILSQAPLHSEAAFYLMKEYKVQPDLNNNCENEDHRVANRQRVVVVEEGSNVKRLSNGEHKVNGNGYTIPNGFNSHTQDNGDKKYSSSDKGNGTSSSSNGGNYDDRMEHLVDWSKAMLPQIGGLGDKYHDWVNLPVDRDLRLFGPWYLECLTKTPWWMVPLFWVPNISYLVGNEWKTNNQLQFGTLLVHFFSGILMWTIVEYILHRYVFHMDTRKSSKWARTFHFLLHGLHHKVPTDPYRLVFPPIPALIIATVLYQMCFYFFTQPRLILAGGLTGYLIYDMIHYYLHYGSPTLKYLYHIKRYHYQHHFVHHDKGFGISSPLWDYVFRTDIVLRKLKLTLKW